MSSSRIQVVIQSFHLQLKEEHTLEQEELFCCVINSGIKQKRFVIFPSRAPDPFSSETTDYLRINSVTTICKIDNYQ